MPFVRHLRSNAVAYLALFVALGGTSAWAASQIGSGDIRDDSIKSRDIANDKVTGDDVDESTLVLPAGGNGPALASGRIGVDDTGEDTGGEKVTLLETSSGFTVQGVCNETAEGVTATVRLGSALGSSVISTDGYDQTQTNSVPAILEVTSLDARQEQAMFSAEETTGRAVQGIAYAGVGVQGRDCVFSASVLESISG